MAANRTFSIIKPDATRRNLTGAVTKMLEEAGVLGVVMETASSTAQHPRWRVVAPTSRPFPPESVC